MSSSRHKKQVAGTTLSLMLVAGGVALQPQAVSADDGSDDRTGAASRGAGKNTLFGSTAQRRNGRSYRDALQRTNRKFGAVEIVRVFHSGLPSSWADLRGDFGKKKLVVSFKVDPTSINSGKYDRFFRKWFRDAPKRRRTFWSYYHEPEDNIENGQFTARQYRRAWRHLDRLASKANNRKLKSTLVLMAWSLEPASHRRWHRYYVPKAIDVLGWDAYNHKMGNGGYGSPRGMLGRVVRVSRRQNRPFGIAELGSFRRPNDSGHGRARWLKRTGRYLAKHNATFVSYFDSNVSDGDFRLLDRPSKRAWRHVINSVD